MKRTKTYLLLTVMMLIHLTVRADNFTLKGKVIDEDNNALELVTVSCLEQGKVTMTNLQGEFSITLSSADSVEVRFSMIGYAEGQSDRTDRDATDGSLARSDHHRETATNHQH